jgi:hypothetical protein
MASRPFYTLYSLNLSEDILGSGKIDTSMVVTIEFAE